MLRCISSFIKKRQIMKIAILDDYQDAVKSLDCFSMLKEHEVTVFNESFTSIIELSNKLKSFDILVLIRERTIISEELLQNLPNLKIISQTGKVSNHINIELCSKYSVKVLEGKGSPIAPSELCWTLIMSASRNIVEYSSNLSLNKWQDSNFLGLGRTLDSLTLGIWGYGKIGKRIAQYAKVFNMKVLVWGSSESREKALKDGFLKANSKEEFFSSCDVLSLHLRLNENTFNCVKKEDLALMKKDSLFVNISRSELVQKDVLYEELKNNPSKRAAIDVYDLEPLSKEIQDLSSLENTLCTPHLGYVEKNSYNLYFKIAFENIIEELKTK